MRASPNLLLRLSHVFDLHCRRIAFVMCPLNFPFVMCPLNFLRVAPLFGEECYAYQIKLSFNFTFHQVCAPLQTYCYVYLMCVTSIAAGFRSFRRQPANKLSARRAFVLKKVGATFHPPCKCGCGFDDSVSAWNDDLHTFTDVTHDRCRLGLYPRGQLYPQINFIVLRPTYCS
jgi:hypothetical protein